jgi:plasmid stabilization system protein ParE
MASVSFLPAAEQDYQEALAWYQARSVQAAAGFEAAMEVALQRLCASPELSPMCDERHRFYVLRRYGRSDPRSHRPSEFLRTTGRPGWGRRSRFASSCANHPAPDYSWFVLPAYHLASLGSTDRLRQDLGQ